MMSQLHPEFTFFMQDTTLYSKRYTYADLCTSLYLRCALSLCGRRMNAICASVHHRHLFCLP